MKQAFRLSGAGVAGAVALFLLFFTSFISVRAQTPTPTPTPSAATPDSFIAQITAAASDSFVDDISGNGRFMVIESTGDIATLKPGETESSKARNNADGNREIFLVDYAQRRIFQITNTKSLLKDPTKPPVDTTKTPPDFSNTLVEVSNNRPFISHDGRFIVFSSNAYNDATGANPGNFDPNASGTGAALQADGNQEIFLYQIPAVPDVDLTSGADVPFTPLDTGTFIRVTNTPASTPPQAGTTTTSPFVADDNRDATINDDGSRIAFVSTRNLPTVNGLSNPDGTPQIFVYNATANSITQVTNQPTQNIANPIFSENPSISGDGSVIAFVSNANIPNVGATAGNNPNNSAQIYVATVNGTAVTSIRQVTNTTPSFTGIRVNILSPGRRLSRNGNLIAFESAADLAGTGTIQTLPAIYIYNISANTFTQIGQRPTTTADLPVRLPTFTGDSSTLVFASTLNFNTDGTISTSTTAGLNPTNLSQLFAVPVATPNSFVRLTNVPSTFPLTGISPVPSDTIRRIAFTTGGELGGGNPTGNQQAYYMLIPPTNGSDTPASANAISYATGATIRPVASPSPSPTPAEAVTGLAPGMLGIATSSTAKLAPSSQQVDKNNAQEDARRPPLPIELSGVSVSIGNAAAGLYFVSPGQINFVVPVGLAANTTTPYPVVVNNNGTVIRSTLLLNPAEPDIFSSTNGPGGRAVVFNVTNPMQFTTEPFSVTTTIPNSNGMGTQTVPTVLRIMLTGARNVASTDVTVTIGTTAITGSNITLSPADTGYPAMRTAGFDFIDVQLPASLAGAGDVPIVISVTVGGVTTTSRSTATAPHITIQ